MLKTGHRAGLAVLAMLALGVGACGSSTSSSPASTGSASKLTGSITVFAAASLTEAFKDAQKTLEQNNPGFTVTYSFAGSQQLVTNIQNGAPADVIATADLSTMQKLTSAGLVGTPQVFARNTLEIAVAKGNPKHITGLADLANPAISVVLADPSVPVGKFSREALAKAGVSVTPKSNELDVKSTLQKVESGDADAAIVYTTDISSASDKVDGVVIPENQNVIAVYPIAVVKASQNQAAAAAFVQSAVSGDVQRALLKRGFKAP
ncbi:MAG TPA: molybdate ABC transporter substrate-binding protein [Candidatus Dormibacteraeota bacterium]